MWTIEEENFLKEFYLDTSAEYCAWALDRRIHSITHKVERLKLKKPRALIDVLKFLDIQCPKVSYILGLLWADGHVSKDKVVIGLSKDDMENVEKEFESVGKWAIHIRTPKIKTWKTIKILGSGKMSLVNFFLENDYNIKSFASPTKILNKIPENLRHYFWRGYFDGDGCISVFKKWNFGTLVFTGAYTQDWTDLEKLLKSLNIKYKTKKSISKLGHKQSRVLITNKKGINIFCNYIYRNRENDNIGFDRKYNKFLYLLWKQKYNTFK